METYDELEAEAAEWRGMSLPSSFLSLSHSHSHSHSPSPSLTYYPEMVDKLTAERQELEDLVRAEHAEKEFFLRKLMEANKDAQTLNSGKERSEGEEGRRGKEREGERV